MEIVIILGLIFFNGILSMSEIAMVSARKSRLETAAKKGSKTAKTALRLANEPDRFLSTIQIGITLIGILTGLYSGDALAGDLARWLETIGIPQAHSLTLAKGIIVILVTYLTLILGELVPKHLGMNAPEKIARLIGPWKCCPKSPLLSSGCFQPAPKQLSGSPVFIPLQKIK